MGDLCFMGFCFMGVLWGMCFMGSDPDKYLLLKQNRSKKLYFDPLKPTFQGSKQHCKNFVAGLGLSCICCASQGMGVIQKIQHLLLPQLLKQHYVIDPLYHV